MGAGVSVIRPQDSVWSVTSAEKKKWKVSGSLAEAIRTRDGYSSTAQPEEIGIRKSVKTMWVPRNAEGKESLKDRKMNIDLDSNSVTAWAPPWAA